MYSQTVLAKQTQLSQTKAQEKLLVTKGGKRNLIVELIKLNSHRISKT